MRKMVFSNRERNKNTLDSLTRALANRDKTVINPGTVYVPQGNTTNNDNILGGAGSLLTGGLKLYSGLNNSGLFGSNEGGSEAIGNAINNSVYGSGESTSALGGAINNSVLGSGESTSALGSAIGSEAGGFSMPGGGWLSLGTGLMNGLNKGFNHSDDKEIMGGFGNGIQGFFNVNENDSDVMQGINGTLDGAMKGTAIFPGVGTVIGALLGLGSSFLDDI